MTRSTPPRWQVRGATRSFGAVQALCGADLTVDRGEVVALVGDNGAGKSTLIKGLSGVTPFDGGQVLRDGQAVTLPSPRAAMAAGIFTVYQDLALCDELSVTANLFLGREQTGPGRLPLLDEVHMEAAARAVLQDLGVHLPDLRARVSSLSGGQRQCVAVARAVLGAPSLVILDEPTAALAVSQVALVLELVRRLRARGLGVLLISHNLQDVFAVADRVVVMRLGRVTAGFPTAGTSPTSVVAAITGAAA